MTESHPDNSAAASGPSVYLETFGCQMNVLDSQLVQSQLQGLGYAMISDWKLADVILYNTCSVRERAEQKVWSRVGEVGVHKKAFPHVVLGVIGCMAERDGTDMIRKHPQIDLLVGPGELDKVPQLIDNRIKTDLANRGGKRHASIALQGNTHRRSATRAAAEDTLELLDLSRSFSPDQDLAGGRSAYVRITRGCNKFCTYCVVPQTRGAEIHRPPDHIVAECQKLVEQGAREITLLGQTVNHYHYDTSAKITVGGIVQPQVGAIIKHDNQVPGVNPWAKVQHVTTFAKLLARIHDEVEDLERLRFITSFPRDFGNDILEVIRDRPRICRYLHLPVQSGSDRMLKLMNRGHTVEDYRDLLARVRDHLPDAELATDLICGFPTETQDDHQATMQLLREGRFKNSFIFKYSPRPGTPAYGRMEDDVPAEVKKRRNNELLAVQSEVSQQVHDAYIGRTVRVFVESVSSRQVRQEAGSVSLGWEKKPQSVTQLTARTDGDLIVCFDGDPSMIGQTVEVNIDRAAPLALFGQLSSVAAAAR